MRTLQEKYNAIQEGSFSKDQFLRDARMQHPTLVTQYNGYDDAVKILKNRGMIAENNLTDTQNQLIAAPIGAKAYGGGYGPFEKIKSNTWQNRKTGSLSHSQALASQIGSFEDFRIEEQVGKPVEPLKKVVSEVSYKVSPNSKEAQNLKKGDVITGGEVVSVSSGAKTPSGKVEVVIKGKDGKTRKHIWGKYTKIGVKPKKETVSEARLTKKNLADYRYKPTNDMDKYPYEQILRGLRVELEGMEVNSTPTAEEYKKALEKVLKNLEKDEIFYTNQLAGKKKSDKTYDQMIPVEKNNVVDKSNGMEKIKNLKEDHTRNTKDKYKVKFSKTNNTYQVWEGDHLVTDFATKEKAKAYADNENKKQGLEERVMQEEVAEKYRVLPITKDGKKVFQVMKGAKVEKVFPNRHEAEFHRNKLNKVDLKEGIKNLIKNILKEEEDFEYKEEGVDFIREFKIGDKIKLDDNGKVRVYTITKPGMRKGNERPKEDEFYLTSPGTIGFDATADWIRKNQIKEESNIFETVSLKDLLN